VFEFRARDFQHSGLAPGRILFNYCDTIGRSQQQQPQQSKKNGMFAPSGHMSTAACGAFPGSERKAGLKRTQDLKTKKEQNALQLGWGYLVKHGHDEL
jgi:hypothetical protein